MLPQALLLSEVRCQKKEGETMKEKIQNRIGMKIKRRELSRGK